MGWMYLNTLLQNDPRPEEEKKRLLDAADELPNAREINERFSPSEELIDPQHPEQGTEPKIQKSKRRFRTAFPNSNQYEFGLGIPAILGWPLDKDGTGKYVDNRTAAWHAKCTDQHGIPGWLRKVLRRIMLQSLSADNEHEMPSPMRLLVSWEEDPDEPNHWQIRIAYGGRGQNRRYARINLIGPGLDVERPPAPK